MTPSAPTIRASDAEREQHVELLRENAALGRLSVDELSDRLDSAYAAQTRGELAVLVADLPVLVADVPVVAERPRRRSLPAQLPAFVAVNLLLIAIWAATGADYFWPIWPLLGWGLGLIGPCSRSEARRRPQAR